MKVWFVGAGPGDPGLITLKGRDLIEKADVVIYAGSLVSREIVDYAKNASMIYDSSSMTLEEVTEIYHRERDTEGIIVRLHTGDPSIYGAIQEQLDWCRRNLIETEVVPGVSSVSAAAAAMQRELTLPGVTQTIVLSRIAGRTPVPPKETLANIGSLGSSLCLFLSVGSIDRVVDELSPIYGSDAPVAVVYRASWPDEKIVTGKLCTIADAIRSEGITRQAIIIVSPVLGSEYDRSRLYDGAFSHGYRGTKD